jgi:toxin-antitoxin system PIN domain toxin
VKLVDANVLLNAVNELSDQHEEARVWLDDALAGDAPVGFTWVALLGFLRISTRAGVFDQPMSVEQALESMSEWLARPAAHLLHPTPRHADVLADLLRARGTGGNLTTDAHLAALAQEHHATVVTYDSDFSTFGVHAERPSPRRPA